MKQKDNIEARYRDHVARLAEGRPGSGYHETLLPEEIDEIWEEVSSELDIGDAWLHISSGLDRTMPPLHGPGFIPKFSAALLLIFSVLIYVEKTTPETNANCQETSAIIADTENSDNLFTGNYSDETTGEGDSNPFVQKSASVYEAEQNIKEPSSGHKKKLLAGSSIDINRAGELQLAAVAPVLEDGPLASLTGTYPNERAINQPLYSQASPEISVIVFKAYPESLKTRRPAGTGNQSNPMGEAGKFYGGLITTFKNTWLLTRETFNGLRSESLNTTEFVVFPDAGLSLGYGFTEKWSAQAEAFLYSSTGQEYRDYIFGRYARKKIVLRYSTLAFRTKYNISGKGNTTNRSSFSFNAGGYLSFLHNADQVINDEVSKIKSDYKRFDYGITLGGEFELHLNEYFSIAPGLNLTLGLSNIYKGNANNPGNPRRTHNGNAAFQLSFYYHFE